MKQGRYLLAPFGRAIARRHLFTPGHQSEPVSLHQLPTQPLPHLNHGAARPSSISQLARHLPRRDTSASPLLSIPARFHIFSPRVGDRPVLIALLPHPVSRTVLSQAQHPFCPALTNPPHPSPHLFLRSDPTPCLPPTLPSPNPSHSQKPPRPASLLASLSRSPSPHGTSPALFPSPRFGRAAGTSPPQLFMPNNAVSLFSRAPQSVHPSVLPGFILQF